MSKMLRNYQYLVGNNLDRSFEGRTLKEYVEGVTSTAVTGLLGMAPEELDTLGELSAAIQNNPDFLTTLQGRDADLLEAIGIAPGAKSVGDLTTSELPDNETVKALFEAVGEAARRLREGLGVAQGESDLGTFTGSTISDAASVKTALQELETFIESNSAVAVQAFVEQQIATDMWMFADQAAFPSAASNHGRVVHSHADGAMFFAHAGAWHKLQTDASVDADESSLQGAIDAAVARLDALEVDPTTATAVAAVATDLVTEATDRLNADNALDARLDALEADPTTATDVAAIATDVVTESINRVNADNALDARLDILEADPTTQTAVDAVNQSLTISLGSLAGDVTANKTASDTAEAVLAGRLDTLEVDPTTGAAVNAVATSVTAAEVRISALEVDPTTATAVAAGDAATSASATAYTDAGDAATLAAANAHTDAEIASLIDSAPGAINTLNELAAAIGDDANFAATVTNSIATEATARTSADAALDARVNALELDPTTATAVAAVQTDVDANEAAALAGRNAIQADVDANEAAALAGRNAIQADVDQNEADSDAADAALSARIATLEADPTTGTSVAAEAAHIDNLVTLSGVAEDSTHLGDFSGTTIASNQTIKEALQSLETSIETFDVAQGVADIVDGTTNFTGFKLQNTTVLTTGTELNFVDGVTSNIQNQLDAIQTDVDQNESDADAAIAAVQADVDQNEADADAAIAAVQADVDANEIAAAALVTAENTAMLAAVAVVQADVDQNESDADAAIALKADIASPTFTGTPAAPTAAAGTNTTQLATTAYVATAVANLIDGAPGAIDTLNELAAAINDDANFSTTITNSIAAVQADVNQNEADADAAIAAVQADVDQNEADADAAIAAVQADVDQNEADADAAIALKLDASAVSTFGGTLVDDADAAAARTTLGLGTAATTAASAYATAAQGATADAALAASAVSTFGGTLIDDADAAAARTTLGLGDVATTDAADYATAAQGAKADSAVQPAAISNVDNTSDANKPVSTATQTALDLKANAADAALTGTPTAPTAAADTNTTQIATTAYVQGELTALIGGAPSGLDTLKELADALESDTQAIQNVTTLINANEAHVDNLATLSGVAKDAVNLGTFTGSTIADNETLKGALQDLETALDGLGAGGGDSLSDLRSFVGGNAGDTHLGSLGNIITSGVSVKTALYELSTEIEANHTAAATRSALGITENAGDPADGRGMYYDTSASKYLLSS